MGMNRKIISIVIIGLVVLILSSLLTSGEHVHAALQAALWAAAGTAVLAYWPRSNTWQIISLCWLSILLYAMAAFSAIFPKQAQSDYPIGEDVLIFICIPFLMVMLPFVVLMLRSAYRDHMRSILEETVLAATDSLHGPAIGAVEKARELLAKGTCADYIPDAMVARDEQYFEAISTPHPEAVRNALELLPLLNKAGAGISQQSLDSAKYNCPPAIQQELQKLPRQS